MAELIVTCACGAWERAFPRPAPRTNGDGEIQRELAAHAREHLERNEPIPAFSARMTETA